MSSSPEPERDPAELTPEARLWQLVDQIEDVNLIRALLTGGETDPDLLDTTRVNFEIGGIFYQKVKALISPATIRVGIARSGDLQTGVENAERYGLVVGRLEGLGEDYLSAIRSYRIGAERGLWNLNIRRIRLSAKDRAQTADTDVLEARKLHKELNSAAAQLNGAAQAALEDNDLRLALLLCEAAGDFLPEGQTVIRINEQLSRKDETLEGVLGFMKEKGGDPLTQALFKDTMSAIRARMQGEERNIRGFEENTLPKLGKPGDAMYNP